MKPPESGFLIGALLLCSAEAVNANSYKRFQEAGFTDIRPIHQPVFGLLRPEGDRVVDLAKRAKTSKQAMGYLVDYLEERGYLERIPDPKDRRAQIVRRTERGWEVNRLAKRAVQELQDQWAAQLGVERMEELLRLLHDLVTIIGIEYEGSVSQRTSQNE